MEIYYEIIGQGYPIVCLHGNGEDHHIFDEFVEVFSTHYQMILIDSRYHGKSIHEGTLSYEQMMEDVIHIMNDLHIDAYDVVGFSDGGILSLLLGMNDKRLKHMICIGANTNPQGIKRFYRIMMSLREKCLLPFCLYHSKARLDWKLLHLMLTEPHISYHQLSQIKIPTLVLAGEFDMIKETETMKIGEYLPYGIVKIIKRANHFLLTDFFQESIHEIRLFLEACHKED